MHAPFKRITVVAAPTSARQRRGRAVCHPAAAVVHAPAPCRCPAGRALRRAASAHLLIASLRPRPSRPVRRVQCKPKGEYCEEDGECCEGYYCQDTKGGKKCAPKEPPAPKPPLECPTDPQQGKGTIKFCADTEDDPGNVRPPPGALARLPASAPATARAYFVRFLGTRFFLWLRFCFARRERGPRAPTRVPRDEL